MLLMVKGLPGLAVGVTLLRTVMFPFMAGTQQGCMQSKLTKHFAAHSREGGDLFTFCGILISIYDSVRQVQNDLG